MGKILFGCVAGALAGALGGGLMGFGEALLVTFTSGAADEYWLFLFGVLAYGAFGAAIGLGASVAWQLLRRGRAGDFELAQLAAGLGCFVPLLAVGRYHVAQRIFSEGLNFSSARGLIAHGLIVLGAVLVALLIVGLVRLLYRFVGSSGPLLAFVAMVGIGALIGATTGVSGDVTPQRHTSGGARGKPNMILIVVDTLRSDAVDWNAAGGGFAQLGRDGVVFERAYSQASWTRPSVATILTAQYPSTHGTIHKMDFLSDRVQTAAESLREQGYWTAAFTTNINVAPIFNLNQGFAEFEYIAPSFYFGASDSATKLAIYKGLRTARERFFADRVYFEHFYQDAQVVNEHVGKWLASKPPEPFFLFIHYMDPHDPYFEMPYDGHGVARVMNPSPPLERAEELHSLYLQGVRYHDEGLQALIEQLRQAGVYDNSVIAVTADHGEEFTEHGDWWHGTSLYDEQVHVPLVIVRPDRAEAGSRRSDPVRSVDIAPTLFAAAGVPASRAFQGIDVFAARVEEPIVAEEDLEGNSIVSVRSGGWKLLEANRDNPRGLQPVELYNLENDPGEKNNLAATETARVEELRAARRRVLGR